MDYRGDLADQDWQVTVEGRDLVITCNGAVWWRGELTLAQWHVLHLAAHKAMFHRPDSAEAPAP